MMESEGNQPELSRKGHRQKAIAFLVTGFSLLGILTVGWATLIKGYQVRSSIPIQLADHASEADFQSLVANAYRSVSTDAQLSEMVTRLRQQIPVRSAVLLGETAALQDAVWAETVAVDDSGFCQVHLVLQGNASKEERRFLANLTDELKIAIEKMTSNSELSGKLVIGDLKLAKFRHRLRNLQNSAAAMETNYEAICQQIERTAGSIDGRQTSGNQQPFRSASHRRPDSNYGEEDLRRLLEFDCGAKIEKELQLLIEDSWESLSSSPSSIQASGASEFSIVPIGGPDFKNFLVLLILAVAGGLVTAVHYQPFAYRGFASIPAVSQRLRIPVVATLPINQHNRVETVSNRSFDRKIPWANRLADAASIFIVALLVLIVGFCIFSEEIRGEFFRNPFDGITRILWFLMGY